MVSQRIIKQRESLPIFNFRLDIIDAIKNQNLLIIIGETGKITVVIIIIITIIYKYLMNQ